MPVELSRTTGFSTQMINAGTVRNWGWEALARVVPVVTRDFRWETSFSYARNRNRVVRLTEGVEGLQLSNGDFWNVENWARVGEPLGQLIGVYSPRLAPDWPSTRSLWLPAASIAGCPTEWRPAPCRSQGRAGTANDFSTIGSYFLQPSTPSVLMSHAEVLFLGAEAAARGWIAEDAATLYRRAIAASMGEYGIGQSAIDAYL